MVTVPEKIWSKNVSFPFILRILHHTKKQKVENIDSPVEIF